MKKKNITLTIFAMLSVCTVSWGQIKITDQFGNLKTVQAGTEPWNVVGSTTPSFSNASDIYQTGKVGIGNFSATAIDKQLDVNGNARIRNLEEGINQTVFTRTVVAKNDGTLGYTSGDVRNLRIADSEVTRLVNSDEIVIVPRLERRRVVLPSNPPVGQVIKIISLTEANVIVSTSATDNANTLGYIPNKGGNETVNPVIGYTAGDYVNIIKSRTVLELVFVAPGFVGGSGWIQISGDRQF